MIYNQTVFQENSVSRDKSEQLKKLIVYVYNNSSYWKKMIDELQISINDFDEKSLIQLPVLTKELLQQNIKEMICVDTSKVIDYVCTSGTTSNPVHIPLTDNDLERLAYNEYQSILRTEATKNDIFLICTTLDKQFMAGVAYFLGLKRLGAGIIRLGIVPLELYWKTIKELKPTYLIAVPSFIMKLLEFAKANNIDFANSSVKKIICIGENIRKVDFSLNTLGKRITQSWNVQLFSTYASTEMATAFTECMAGKGGHHNEDLLHIELLDTENNPVKIGEIGELTVTTFGIEGLPLLRYKTGDLCQLIYEVCSCGSTSARISPIIGRTAQRIKYKGTTLYISSIFETLNKFSFINDSVVIIKKDIFGNDTITIHLALIEDTDLTILKNTIKSVIRVLPEIKIHKSIVPLRKQYKLNETRKITKVIDLRKNYKI